MASKTWEKEVRKARKALAKREAEGRPVDLDAIAARHAAKIAERKYQEAITGADPVATEKLIRGLKSSQ